MKKGSSSLGMVWRAQMKKFSWLEMYFGPRKLSIWWQWWVYSCGAISLDENIPAHELLSRQILSKFLKIQEQEWSVSGGWGKADTFWGRNRWCSVSLKWILSDPFKDLNLRTFPFPLFPSFFLRRRQPLNLHKLFPSLQSSSPLRPVSPTADIIVLVSSQMWTERNLSKI